MSSDFTRVNNLTDFDILETLPDNYNLLINTNATDIIITTVFPPGSWMGIGFGDSINSTDPNNIDMLRFIGFECDCEGGPWNSFVEDMHKNVYVTNETGIEVLEDWNEVGVLFLPDQD